MTVHVHFTEDTLDVHAPNLVQFDEETARFSIPYDTIRAARTGPYTPPQGSFRLGNQEMAYADVHAGHYRNGQAWTFVAVDDGGPSVVLELDGFDYALRPYERLVLGVDDAEAFLAELSRRRGQDAQMQAGGGLGGEIAWTALTAGMAVLAQDGTPVGTVTHPLGDLEEDTFEGIAFRHGRVGGTRMARPEQIARLTQDAVTLNLSAAESEALPPVALGDLREAQQGRGIFHHTGWHRDNRWDQP